MRFPSITDTAFHICLYGFAMCLAFPLVYHGICCSLDYDCCPITPHSDLITDVVMLKTKGWCLQQQAKAGIKGLKLIWNAAELGKQLGYDVDRHVDRLLQFKTFLVGLIAIAILTIIPMFVFPLRANRVVKQKTKRLLEAQGNITFQILGEFCQVRTIPCDASDFVSGHCMIARSDFGNLL